MPLTFSAMYSDRLGAAILAAAGGEPFPIACWPSSDDFRALAAAVNVGIDSHLETVAFEEGRDYRGAPQFTIAAESLPVLVRRLLNGDGVTDGDDELYEASESLASGICAVLGIELV